MADSLCVTYVNQPNGEKKITGKARNFMKILNAPNMTLKGEPVEALGFSGEVAVFQGLQILADQMAEHGKPLEMTSDIWAGVPERGLAFALMAVLQKAIVVLRWGPDTGTMVVWDIYERRANTALVIGTGKEVLANQVNHEGVTARHLVSLACYADVLTGGTLDVWKDGKLTLCVPRHGLARIFYNTLKLRVITSLARRRQRARLAQLDRQEKLAKERERKMAF